MREFSLPVPSVVKAALNRAAVTHFVLADSPGEMADYAKAVAPRLRGPDEWCGGLEAGESIRRCHFGDLGGVAASDSLLSRFERFAFESVRREWRNDVSGQVPDVPAFIAGQPMAMRRRVKVASPAAPLAVVVDLTSAALVSAADLEKRGAAILALVRVLSARRPVELWAGTMLDADNMKNAAVHLARIETAPLDLARAAFALTSPAFPRQLLYGAARAKGYQGHWPFGELETAKKNMAALLLPALPHIGELLAIPAAQAGDEVHKGPEQWIERTLASLEAGEAAAA